MTAGTERRIVEDMLTTEYDGCGRCMVGVRRLSRKSDATSSPERQGQQILAAVADAGGHVIAWADDWEVSGATNPLDRKRFGPWLRGDSRYRSRARTRIGGNLLYLVKGAPAARRAALPPSGRAYGLTAGPGQSGSRPAP